MVPVVGSKVTCFWSIENVGFTTAEKFIAWRERMFGFIVDLIYILFFF